MDGIGEEREVAADGQHTGGADGRQEAVTGADERQEEKQRRWWFWGRWMKC
ncbi:hypothetical protein CRG98_032077 [Punica granatum]|uniref:Uncharacterized protein n=1 Tax=Punica granatum TaxID=22663 RepID=A0A2I0IU08_PUNGR|nr:hypothetical protein CRG98_032077 [Punica granatum]